MNLIRESRKDDRDDWECNYEDVSTWCRFEAPRVNDWLITHAPEVLSAIVLWGFLWAIS